MLIITHILFSTHLSGLVFYLSILSLYLPFSRFTFRSHSPFVPQWIFFFFFSRSMTLSSNLSQRNIQLGCLLTDIFSRVTTSDACPCASVHVIEGEPNICSHFWSVASCPCSLRRSSTTLRPKWRSTATTRSSWSSPTRSYSTWKLWETRSTSGKPKKSTTRSPRRPERLDIRWGGVLICRPVG